MSWLAFRALCSCSLWECWAHSGCCQVAIACCSPNCDSQLCGLVPSSPSHSGCTKFPIASALSCLCRMPHVLSPHTRCKCLLPRNTLLFVLVFFYSYAEDFSPSPVKLSSGSQLHTCCLLLTAAASKRVSAAVVQVQVVLPWGSVFACSDLVGAGGCYWATLNSRFHACAIKLIWKFSWQYKNLPCFQRDVSNHILLCFVGLFTHYM